MVGGLENGDFEDPREGAFLLCQTRLSCSHELGCWSGWPNHFTQENDPMDSVQVGKAVFVKEKLHNPGNRTQDLLLSGEN